MLRSKFFFLCISIFFGRRHFWLLSGCAVVLQQVEGAVLYLGDCDGALLGQLLLSLLAGVRVAEVGVKVLIQDLCRLLVEIPSFPSATQKHRRLGTIKINQTMTNPNQVRVVKAKPFTNMPGKSLYYCKQRCSKQ